MVAATITVAVVIVAVLAIHPPAVTGVNSAAEPPRWVNPLDKYRDKNVFYRIKVENRMPAKETMEINCRVGMRFSLGPGQVDTGGLYPADYVRFYDTRARRPVMTLPAPPRAYCVWAYAGNYMNHVPLFSVDWPEAPRCANNVTGGADAYCAAVFEGGQLFVEAPGMPRRLLGDLAIKRCKRHFWVFGWVGADCSLPPHRNAYAGDVLDGWWQYQNARDEINNR